jgi:sterol desaturase/sphingolipid hydroxylase (fatty acid hydroxylase superfamily)
MQLNQVLVAAVPLVFLASVIEALALSWKRPGSYDWKAAGVSVVDMVLRRAMALLPLSLAAPVFVWAYGHRLQDIELSGPVAVGLLFIGQEFCYYWYHRAAHRVRWFWASHSVHHSPNQLNLSAAYRLGLTGRLAGAGLFYTPLVWLGFPPGVVAATLSVNLLYQFWLHVTWIPKLGFLEGIFNTPSAHRVHHASNLDYLDANYGGVLVIFDRLFGTYVAERPELPCVYGLVEPETSYNPFKVEFRAWFALLKDLKQAPSLRAAMGVLLMPPGWQPNGSGETTEELRARNQASP